MNIFNSFFVFFIFLFSFQSLSAYIDPGTGAYIIQVLIAVFAGLLYLVKVFWLQIKNFFAWLVERVRILFGK